MSRKTLVALSLISLSAIAWFGFDLGQHLTFGALANLRDATQSRYADAPLMVALGYFLVYVILTAVSFPGAAIMTLLGGAVFGLGLGTLLVSFASTLGASAAMLLARYLFRDVVRRRFSAQAERIDAGVEAEGAFYLFALRLVPIFPFFAVNLAMSLTSMRTWTYMWVSQLSMLPATLVFVNAGTELAALDSMRGILAPEFIASFTALGLLPLVSKRVLNHLRTSRLQRDFDKPRSFDRNLVVIGAGAAGLVSSYIAATVRAKVTLIERERMGGDCLYTGCVPSKALLRSATIASHMRRAGEFGIQAVEPEIDFPAVMRRVHASIAKIEPHDSVERYTGLGVECIAGEARIVSPWSVEVNGETLTTRAIIIATGARPAVPAIPGLDQIEFLTSDSLWSLQTLPARLVILGGGPIGCELAQAFARLGAKVTLVERSERLLARDDEAGAILVAQALSADGVELRLGCEASAVTPTPSGGELRYLGPSGEQSVEFDRLLVAVGRVPNVTGFGLEELGIKVGASGVVETDAYLQTVHPNIYACGDVAGPFQFTHTAAHQAWHACVNALFGGWRKFAVDYSAIPRVTYTDPEVAAVGLGVAEAHAANRAIELTEYGLDDLDRAIVEGEDRGFVKVLTEPGSDRILGAVVVGAHAGELIAEFTLAIRNSIGLKKVLGTVHAYPTLMEANKYVAGNWSKAHAPQRLLQWLARYHQWLRK